LNISKQKKFTLERAEQMVSGPRHLKTILILITHHYSSLLIRWYRMGYLSSGLGL
jgi:hypothetical protein